MVFGAILKDMIDGGEDRCGDGIDGFLRPAPALQAEELGSSPRIDSPDVAALIRATALVRSTHSTHRRHCERSEAIHSNRRKDGLLRRLPLLAMTGN
jgi:hypothetical protein